MAFRVDYYISFRSKFSRHHVSKMYAFMLALMFCCCSMEELDEGMSLSNWVTVPELRSRLLQFCLGYLQELFLCLII